MKKKLLSLLLSALLAVASMPFAFAGYENFTAAKSYVQGQFTDVPVGAWYAGNVATAYEYGLINGTTATTFAPDDDLTLAEAVKLAACLRSIYETGAADFSSSKPWYRTYADYALREGIIAADYANYDANATRAQFAVLFAAALPDDALPAINDVEDGAIPDVSSASMYAASVYKLYRAGVLTGSDSSGRFQPSSNITRGEVAAIVTRMADKSLRKSITLLKKEDTSLSSEDLFAKCSPSVFYIEIYDKAGNATAAGSGVFLTASGEAVTNYHVIEGAASAKIQTADGKVYDVSGVYAYDEELDLARIKVNGSGFTPVSIGDSASLATGAKVYAIGSPQGLSNTLSDGIISNAKRTISGMDYIQTTAAISHGSSGGALLNASGELIGITSAYIDGGQNLNLAIPAYYLDELGTGSLKSFADLTGQASQVNSKVACYDGYYPAPDYGAYTGAPVYSKNLTDGIQHYYYDLRSISTGVEVAVDGYIGCLEDNGFRVVNASEGDGQTMLYYYQNGYSIALGFGLEEVGQRAFIHIMLQKS